MFGDIYPFRAFLENFSADIKATFGDTFMYLAWPEVGLSHSRADIQCSG